MQGESEERAWELTDPCPGAGSVPEVTRAFPEERVEVVVEKSFVEEDTQGRRPGNQYSLLCICIGRCLQQDDLFDCYECLSPSLLASLLAKHSVQCLALKMTDGA
ncbi:Hypothetical predicted protein [Pelobates cultripes]|uniref:Uncharacterized protein n=1 Tax=Pelobates cultripes TaxID=61616 RepID=A0AAD1T5B7_PELCU|nr:Hypothetical predicted protein [Pelobates cultripes]